MDLTIEYELGNPRRDPGVLVVLLCLAWRNRAGGGDGLSVCSMFPSHLSTLQAAAQEFVSVPVVHSPYTDCTSDTLKPEWLNLLTLIFHCYFQYMRADGFQDTRPDPLVDALLLICDCSDLEVLSQTPRFSLMLNFLAYCINEGLCSSDSLGDISSFFRYLKAAWDTEKRGRLRYTTQSLMPWSMDSIKEGSLSPPTSATRQARIHPGLVLHAYQSGEKLLTFPEMVWLGASHDGHPRYSSITSYFSSCWSPSFTAYDNAALWQAAMTFGVLEAITDLNIPETLLLEKRSDGTVVFTCRNINVLVYHWIIHVFCNINEGRRRHCLETLLRARGALSTECVSAGQNRFAGLSALHQNDMDDIISTVYLLIDAFSSPLALSYMHNFTYDVNGSRNGKDRAVEVFVQRMVAGGWCPSFRHSNPLRVPQYWWYASSFKPFVQHRLHEHVDCSEDTCAVHSMNEATYKTLHTSPECSCPFITPSINSLRQILRSGCIPAVSYADGSLTVHSACDNLPYVAISHVWVDGLGSSSEKGLPTCQIERIHGYVHELLGPTAIPAFWIDGICIPLDRELRNKAIVMMRQTYQNATKVLVFDSSIRTLCSAANPIEENVFRIGSSMWMQRVWTLQEALLAKDLYFEFSTGIASGADLLRTLLQRTRMDYGVGWMTPAAALASSTPTYQVLLPSITGYIPIFREIMKLLYRRSTSKSKDEPLAIAGLLNVDPEKILSQPDLESRIRTLFIEVGILPRDLIFGEFERMKTPGFRWCPITLTSIGHMAPSSPKAVCTPDGLTTKTEMLILCLPRIDVLEGMDTEIYIKIASIGAYYSLQQLMEALPRDRPCNINALLMWHDVLSPLSGGIITPAVAVNIPGLQNVRDVQTSELSRLRCDYVMRTWLKGCGETWDPAMEGHPMLEGRLIRAKVTVT